MEKLTHREKLPMKMENEIQLSNQQIELGNIKTDTIKKHLLTRKIMFPGKINEDQNTFSVITSRIMGRVENLFIKSTGVVICKGQPLYELYSEDLNLIIAEMLEARKRKNLVKSAIIDYDRVIQGSKEKLFLYGLSKTEVEEIESADTIPYTIKILSRMEGVVYSIDINEGGYLMEGSPVFHIADYSILWMETEVYADYISQIKVGMDAMISLPALPERHFSGKVSFVNPEQFQASKIIISRVQIDNKNYTLKPGMLAYVYFPLSQKKVLSIPSEAILKDGNTAVVWIKSGTNKFKRSTVHIGIEGNGFSEILHGLKIGQEAVVSGAYLLNSEYIIKMGIIPMQDHGMHEM